MAEKANGKPRIAETLSGERKFDQRSFPVSTLADVLREIHRNAGTGYLEIHFKDGQARGDAKWRGWRDDAPQT